MSSGVQAMFMKTCSIGPTNSVWPKAKFVTANKAIEKWIVFDRIGNVSHTPQTYTQTQMLVKRQRPTWSLVPLYTCTLVSIHLYRYSQVTHHTQYQTCTSTHLAATFERGPWPKTTQGRDHRSRWTSNAWVENTRFQWNPAKSARWRRSPPRPPRRPRPTCARRRPSPHGPSL